MHRTFKELLASDELIRIFCVGRLIHPVVFDIHGMVGGFHGIWIDPANSDHLVTGCDGGINITWDRARTWDYVNTITIAQFYEIDYDMKKPYLLEVMGSGILVDMVLDSVKGMPSAEAASKAQKRVEELLAQTGYLKK